MEILLNIWCWIAESPVLTPKPECLISTAKIYRLMSIDTDWNKDTDWIKTFCDYVLHAIDSRLINNQVKKNTIGQVGILYYIFLQLNLIDTHFIKNVTSCQKKLSKAE